MGYIITTDSTCDLDKNYYSENNIKVIGLSYHVNGKVYNEASDDALTSREFYDLLREGHTSSTAQVNIYEFVEFLEPMLKEGHDILHLAFSSGLSGTYESYISALDELKEKYPERKILVPDSLAAAQGEGLLLDYIIKNQKSGMSIEENYNWIEENKLNMNHVVTVDDLMHLHRGGRVSKTSAVVGSLLGIKPIIEMNKEGKLEVIAKVRGRDKALMHLVNMMKQRAFDNIKEQRIYIGHGDCLEDAEKLAEMVRKEIGATDITIYFIGSVIGSHTGPGVMSMYFMGESR